jgi:HEAT repeat protein
VEEMNSKTFGNRWIAAYELSKFLASQKIPQEDMPWVIENLSKVYRESLDARTRNFVVLALGSLNNPLSLPTLNLALNDQDSATKFNAVVALGNMSKNSNIDWNKIEEMLKQSEDVGLTQAALLTMATHNRPNLEKNALFLLKSSEKVIRYAAAMALIQSRNAEAIPVIQEIFGLRYDIVGSGSLNGAQVEALKVNILENLEKSKWSQLYGAVLLVQQDDTNVRVNTKAKQVLKILKN